MKTTRYLLLAGAALPALILSVPGVATPAQAAASADRAVIVAQADDGEPKRRRGGDEGGGGGGRDRGDGGGRDRGDGAGRAERQRPDKAERQQRPDAPERAARPDRTEKPDRAERQQRPDAPERAQRPDRTEKPDRAERQQRPDPSERAQKPDGLAPIGSGVTPDRKPKESDKPKESEQLREFRGDRKQDAKDKTAPSDAARPSTAGDDQTKPTRGNEGSDAADRKNANDADSKNQRQKDNADRRDAAPNASGGALAPGLNSDAKDRDRTPNDRKESLGDRMRRDRQDQNSGQGQADRPDGRNGDGNRASDPSRRDGDRPGVPDNANGRRDGDRNNADGARDGDRRDANGGDRGPDRRDRGRTADQDRQIDRLDARIRNDRDQDFDKRRADFRLDSVRGERRERRDGDRVIITEGDRTIVRDGDRTYIRRDEGERFRYGSRDFREERRGDETVRISVRPDGSEIYTYVDGDGRLLRRSRRYNGEEVVLIDNRPRDGRNGRYVDLGLAPPRISIPREEYIVDADTASYDDIETAFRAPPVERLERRYTLDEIRSNPPLRERVRSVDLDSITFDTGSWDVKDDQIKKLENIGLAMEDAVKKDPKTIFMVEGHTDAVGSDEDNLSLSDRRASAVADVLTKYFSVPAENLTTQGYGEQYLKVKTEGPEVRNRRVSIRNITTLLQTSQK